MSRSLSIAIFLGLITMISTTTSADTPDCPYPCLPPPTSGSSINSYPPPPPSTDGSSGGGSEFGGSYAPPPPGSYQLVPPGVMPGYLAPPNGGYPSRPTPPPPNPVLPWFPWYYQRDNPITGSTSAASSPAVRGRLRITAAVLLPLSLLLVLLRAW